MNEAKDILKYIVRQELNDDQKMEMFTTEDNMNDSVEVISNDDNLVTHVRQLFLDTFSYRKRLAKYIFYKQLGYTFLLSRFHLKEAGGAEREKSNRS